MYFAVAEQLKEEAMNVPTSKTSNFEVHTVQLPAPLPVAPPPAPAFSMSSRVVADKLQLDKPGPQLV